MSDGGCEVAERPYLQLYPCHQALGHQFWRLGLAWKQVVEVWQMTNAFVVRCGPVHVLWDGGWQQARH